jgi:hypothetical protein
MDFLDISSLKLPIDMFSKSRRNLGTRTNISLCLKICNNQSMVNTTLTIRFQKTHPSHMKIRVTLRQTRTLESGVISKKSPSKTPMNFTQNNQCWSSSKKKSRTQFQNMIQKIMGEERSSMQTHCYYHDWNNSTKRTNKC